MTSEKPLIMLIDDDRDFLDLNRRILEAKGYRVVCFSDPNVALAEMASRKPDVVITDLMMKDLDSGFVFSKKIKGDPRFKDIPVIIITAASSKRGFDFTPRTQDELDAMSADAYFDKPIVPEALLAKVEELLEK